MEFSWILGQHDILVLGDVPLPQIITKFLSKARFKLADVPPPRIEKKSSKNKMLVFGLLSTSDDQPSNWSNESQLKCKKRPPKSSKNEMLIFGLCSTSDDQPSDPRDES